VLKGVTIKNLPQNNGGNSNPINCSQMKVAYLTYLSQNVHLIEMEIVPKALAKTKMVNAS
jgi:hypothetical protein